VIMDHARTVEVAGGDDDAAFASLGLRIGCMTRVAVVKRRGSPGSPQGGPVAPRSARHEADAAARTGGDL